VSDEVLKVWQHHPQPQVFSLLGPDRRQLSLPLALDSLLPLGVGGVNFSPCFTLLTNEILIVQTHTHTQKGCGKRKRVKTQANSPDELKKQPQGREK
jgi:hypothetical protein